MPRSIITIYDGNMKPLGQALDGPTGVIGLYNPDEASAVAAVIDGDGMANQAQIDVYNAVLRRGVVPGWDQIWDNHFEATPGGGNASMGDIVAAIYSLTHEIQYRVRGTDPNVDSFQRLNMNDADILAAVVAD